VNGSSSSFVLLMGGHLLLPAEQLTGLLRKIAEVWLESDDDLDPGLDPETVSSLAAQLSEIADKIDTECIALLPLDEEHEENPEREENPDGPLP